MRVLFLGSHCDDIEFGCGGTIHKRQNDWDITCVTLSVNSNVNQVVKSDITEYSQGAMRVLNVRNVIYGDFITNEFHQQRQKIWEFLKDIEKTIRPDVVFTQEEDDQQDHAVLWKETLRNFRKSSVISYKSSIRNAPNINHNYYETLDETNVKAKLSALTHYSPVYEDLIYFSKDNIESTMRVNGIYIEEEYAEAYNCVKFISR